MLKRFLEVQNSVEHVLKDFGFKEMFPSEEDLTDIGELVKALDHIEACSRLLGGNTVSLAKADKMFELMLAKLRPLKTPLGKSLAFEVEYRIKERRNKGISTLLAYLDDPNFLNTLKNPILDYSSKAEIEKVAQGLLSRLYPSEQDAITQTQIAAQGRNP